MTLISIFTRMTHMESRTPQQKRMIQVCKFVPPPAYHPRHRLPHKVDPVKVVLVQLNLVLIIWNIIKEISRFKKYGTWWASGDLCFLTRAKKCRSNMIGPVSPILTKLFTSCFFCFGQQHLARKDNPCTTCTRRDRTDLGLRTRFSEWYQI